MPVHKKTYHIKKDDFIHAGDASINIKNLLKLLNIDSNLIRKIAICVYEAEMNVVMHGGDGELTVEINSSGIMADIVDDGVGIKDVELAMKKGYSTATEEYREMGFGAGMGLPNIKKNSDQLIIKSKEGEGTRVNMVFFMTEERGE